MSIRFIYFDLGMVIVRFSLDRMFRQMGDVTGLAPARVRELLFDTGLQQQLEVGRITLPEFFDRFCQAGGVRPRYDDLLLAANAIFELNTPIVPVIGGLVQAGYRLGILSNTCENHWVYCRDRYRLLADDFAVQALSYEIRAMKPDLTIYRAAAELAGVPPEAIFFTDDLPANVEGARQAGWNAFCFTGAAALADALRAAGVRFNY